jgi:hypothetical protein
VASAQIELERVFDFGIPAREPSDDPRIRGYPNAFATQLLPGPDPVMPVEDVAVLIELHWDKDAPAGNV